MRRLSEVALILNLKNVANIPRPRGFGSAAECLALKLRYEIKSLGRRFSSLVSVCRRCLSAMLSVGGLRLGLGAEGTGGTIMTAWCCARSRFRADRAN